MVLWVALSVLLALTLAVLLRPLFARDVAVEGGEDTAVYAAQLEELEADRARGLISEHDADAARTEIARRLLRASRRSHAQADSTRWRWLTAAVVLVALPAASLAAYLTLGAPNYADQPLAARFNPDSEEDLERLLARAERQLADNPDDGEGWAVVAPVYQRLGRFTEAADAYARANTLLGDSAERLGGRAESLTFANDGTVIPQARALFERALALDGDALRPAIYLAIAARQRGDFMEAGERWRALISKSDGSEPWLEIANAEFVAMSQDAPGTDEPRERIGPTVARAATLGEGDADAAGGPPQIAGADADAGEGEASGALSDASREAMIEAMVGRLATRLEAEGGSADEWLRLIRSYRVLGRDDEAREAAASAMRVLSDGERARLAAAPELQDLTP